MRISDWSSDVCSSDLHDLHHKTLTGLKRLMEVVADAGVLLSVLLVGHPRLRNDLRRPQMEEIGYRTTTFDYEGIGAERRDYVAWLLGACAAEGVKVVDLMNEDAIDLIAERLRTPLQIEMHRSEERRAGQEGVSTSRCRSAPNK